MTAAVVLAAGLGTRMGGPKALLLHASAPASAEQPLVRLHVDRLREAGATEIVVVVHPSFAARVEASLTDAAALVITAATTEQAESLGVALRALGREWESVWIALVDTVPASLATFVSLAAAVEAGAPCASPRALGQGGHPVLARRAMLAPYLDGHAPRLRDLLDATPGRARVEVSDPAIAHDLDAPADLTAPPRFA